MPTTSAVSVSVTSNWKVPTAPTLRFWISTRGGAMFVTAQSAYSPLTKSSSVTGPGPLDGVPVRVPPSASKIVQTMPTSVQPVGNGPTSLTTTSPATTTMALGVAGTATPAVTGVAVAWPYTTAPVEFVARNVKGRRLVPPRDVFGEPHDRWTDVRGRASDGTSRWSERCLSHSRRARPGACHRAGGPAGRDGLDDRVGSALDEVDPRHGRGDLGGSLRRGLPGGHRADREVHRPHG